MSALFAPLHPSVLTSDIPDLDALIERDPTIFDRLVSAKDAAVLLDLSENTLRQMRTGSYGGRTGPAWTKNGTRVCYKIRDLVAYARELPRFQMEDPRPSRATA